MAFTHRSILFAALSMGVSFAAISSAEAQCPDWRARGSGLHLHGDIYASTVWDPDGNGPNPAMLVVGGYFSSAGGPHGVAARNIAAWDGAEWRALGEGLGTETAGVVYAVTVHNGELFAAGSFTNSGGTPANSVARWDGAGWRPLGSGLQGGFAVCYALTSFNGELVAGGNFQQAGSIPETNIARWNGSQWRGIAGGTSGDVYALTVFNNQLVAGGAFSHAGGNVVNFIARTSGDSWLPLNIGMGGTLGFSPTGVHALRVFNGELVAGGAFTTAGLTSAAGVAAWNGTTWRSFGSGINGDVPAVRTLAAFDGRLIASGHFSTAGGIEAGNIAAWDGFSWGTLSSGLNGPCYTVNTFDGDLFAGGTFLQAGSAVTKGLARWDGAAWHAMSATARPSRDHGVRAITSWAGSVVLGGFFNTSDTASPRVSRGLVSWNGSQMNDLGMPNAPVLALGVEPANPSFTTNLIVGGEFTNINGVSINRIARINDTFGFQWNQMGAGFNDAVNCITRFNNSTYAAGRFTASGSVGVNRIARWSGSAWEPVGPGPVTGVNGEITAMKAYTSSISRLHLVVGGSFTTAGGQTATRIASFNASAVIPGTSWSTFGDGFNDTVYAIERYNGQTYAGGRFTASGSTPLNYIARWNGSSWESVGSGLNGEVRSMTISNGTLIVGGMFTTAGGLNAFRIARWDGTSWSPVGGGTDGAVRALGTFRGEIQVGGEFINVRNGVLQSPLWARFSEDGVPWIARSPVSTSASCGADATFTVQAAQGYGGLQYQWRKDGIPLFEGPTGNGSTIVTNGVSLHILDVTPEDAGDYDVSLFNNCGGTSSSIASLTVEGGCCPGDFNGDDALNSQDFFDFLTAFFAGAANADFNEDTVVNSQDFFDFLTAFFAGC